jgi:hypothetical protein
MVGCLEHLPTSTGKGCGVECDVVSVFVSLPALHLCSNPYGGIPARALLKIQPCLQLLFHYRAAPILHLSLPRRPSVIASPPTASCARDQGQPKPSSAQGPLVSQKEQRSLQRRGRPCHPSRPTASTDTDPWRLAGLRQSTRPSCCVGGPPGTQAHPNCKTSRVTLPHSRHNPQHTSTPLLSALPSPIPLFDLVSSPLQPTSLETPHTHDPAR